jgi:hypothetical protein
MADGNFMTYQKLLGNCVHEMEILLLAKIRRMATKHVAKNDRIVSPPRSASRTRFILWVTSLIPIRLKTTLVYPKYWPIKVDLFG